jgi:hypothetical protein
LSEPKPGLALAGSGFLLTFFFIFGYYTMSLFDWSFGRKPTPSLPTITTWEDTQPSTSETDAPADQELVAAWPFPLNKPTTVVLADLPKIEQTEAEIKRQQDAEDGIAIAALYEEAAEIRRIEKAELKEIVQEAPSHGIEFVHVGTTSFAWRYHTDDYNDGVYASKRRVIDVSTAICNPIDQFAKWHGSAIAARNMLAGRFITLRINTDYDSPRDAVKHMGFPTLSTEEILTVAKSSLTKLHPEELKEVAKLIS